MSAIVEKPDGVVITVRVQPKSSRNCIIQVGDEIKAYLTAPPVDGAANQACIELFSSLLRLPKSRVLLIAGQKSRQKTIKLCGVSLDAINRVLANDKN